MWLFGKVPGKFWDDKRNRLAYLNWLASKKNWKSEDDFYQLSGPFLELYHGSGLYQWYGASVIKMLRDLRPNVEWLPWKFKSAEQGFWGKEANIKKYFSWLDEQVELDRGFGEWRRPTKAELMKHLGSGLIGCYKQIDVICRKAGY